MNSKKWLTSWSFFGSTTLKCLPFSRLSIFASNYQNHRTEEHWFLTSTKLWFTVSMTKMTKASIFKFNSTLRMRLSRSMLTSTWDLAQKSAYGMPISSSRLSCSLLQISSTLMRYWTTWTPITSSSKPGTTETPASPVMACWSKTCVFSKKTWRTSLSLTTT